MKVVIPYVEGELADETKKWGEEHEAEFVDLTGDDEGYFQLISRLWREGDSFVVVEEDIVPNEEQFTSMLVCNEPWCAGVHKLHDHPDGAPEVWSLGLMKFPTALTERVQIAMLAQALAEDKSWYRIDLCLYPVIRLGGFSEPHLHGPVGRHLGRR
jgi:hypothetical protein